MYGLMAAVGKHEKQPIFDRYLCIGSVAGGDRLLRNPE